MVVMPMLLLWFPGYGRRHFGIVRSYCSCCWGRWSFLFPCIVVFVGNIDQFTDDK